ncbi:hypothetical protein MTsPCn9_34070 [Croceitalea sp. MTPC9]|uniref:hypothetical protein n=1 Tax=unclassified Croceitalea TaxID=2632280 RepID=UPI002B39EA30|nr:hypothetical protein MTsPCn6_34880 [Croceitalea sp. MTPC6]GMN18467.1 hypothetical protein MTsPCn9_34070 [Croceitalea sp. MTPC9]
MQEFKLKELLEFQDLIKNEDIFEILNQDEIKELNEKKVHKGAWKIYAAMKIAAQGKSFIEVSKKIFKSK